jgi:polar amino acid transport system substrate-binding protein
MSNTQQLFRFVIFATVWGCHAIVSAAGAEEEGSLVVGIKPAAPFVILDKSGQNPTGFSIDLIRAVAAQLTPPKTVEFRIQENLREHLEAVTSGAVDVGIAATSYTSARVREVDFSIPFYQGGLGIVTRSKGRGLRFMDVVASPKMLYSLFWLVLFLLLCANVIWLTERGQNNLFDDRWIVGVGQGVWWTIVTMTTVGYGDFVPRKPFSRVLGVIIIVTGIVLFGVSVGTFSSALTLKKLQTDIRVPDDLRNKPVAVVRDTIGEGALRRRGVQVVRKESLQQALKAVENGDVVAAVHDVALLRHHLTRETPNLMLVGPVFDEHGYAMTFPLHSDLRKKVNVAMLELMESHPSRYHEIVEQWFGSR